MDAARGKKGGCAGMRRREAEGSRADCAAIERTSVVKWPQGAARSETQPRNAVAPVPTVADNAPADVPRKAELSEGSRADCEAIERTSEAKCPQGAALSDLDAEARIAKRPHPKAI